MRSAEWNTRPFRIPNSEFRIHAGFTLVELALVAVIIGILMAAVLPRFQQTTQRLHTEHLAFELAQLMRAAHARAVSESQDILWTWDEDAHRARIAPADPAIPPEARAAIESSTLPAAAVVTLSRDATPVGCQCVRFFPDGTSETTTVSVGLQQSVYTLKVDEATSQVLLRAGRAAR